MTCDTYFFADAKCPAIASLVESGFVRQLDGQESPTHDVEIDHVGPGAWQDTSGIGAVAIT